MEEIEYDIIDINTAAAKLLEHCGGHKKLAIYGEMGAGKTTFVRAMCHELGIHENVSSPTFAIVNEYSAPEEKALVYHLDLYRLKTLQEALDIGVENYLEDDNYCFVEWPELIEPVLPSDTVRIKLELVHESQRKIIIL